MPRSSNQEHHMLYRRLSPFVLSEEELKSCGYPHPDLNNHTLRMAPSDSDGQKLTLRSKFKCERCKQEYQVDRNGMPLKENVCKYHLGEARTVKRFDEYNSEYHPERYSCCNNEPPADGCEHKQYHVHRGELELKNYQGYRKTKPKPSNTPDEHSVYALDCEMCYTTRGLELTRVTVVDQHYIRIYDELVKPTNPILDHNTEHSGITASDLDGVTTTLADVQRDLLDMFSDKTILIGHSLHHDLKALKMFHGHIIDTAQLFLSNQGRQRRKSLRQLAGEKLGIRIQAGHGHDSKEDAATAFKLAKWKASRGR